MTMDPHPGPDTELRARRARSFGAYAAAYAEHRPDYPLDALRWGLDGSSLDPVRVLDLAAGTGKLTAGLLSLGLEVTAVEPDIGMLAELRGRLPDVDARQGHAEQIPLEPDSTDAVFVGQAFHWFDIDRSLAEIGRVLRPGGALVALWNHEDDSVPWVAEFIAVASTSLSRGWASRSIGLHSNERFGTFEEQKFRHSQKRTADSLVKTIGTHSHLLVASGEERTSTLGNARKFLAGRPETATGEFDLPLVTTVLRAARN